MRGPRASDDVADLEGPLLGLPGVGPRTAERLAAAGLHTRLDALLLLPRRWDDLRRTTPLGALVEGAVQTTEARVVSARVVFGGRRFLEARLEDDHGGRLVARWFQFRGALKDRFPPGQRLILSGMVRRHQGTLQMIHPETVLLDPAPAAETARGPGAETGRGPGAEAVRGPRAETVRGPGAEAGRGPGAEIGRGVGAVTGSGPGAERGSGGGPGDGAAPAGGAGVRVRYPEIEGVPASVVARMCRAVATRFAAAAPDGLPEAVRRRLQLPTLGESLRALHLADEQTPPAALEALAAGDAPAQLRLAFDELFFLQLALARRRHRFTAAAALPCPATPPAAARRLARFLAALPFTPTAAQRRAIREIGAALALPHPMHRLLQGDVGSGKTVVIFAAALQAVQGGGQVAVMAPTELLAEQHARTFAAWSRQSGLRLALLTASTARPERQRIGAALARGELDLLVGTHALLSDEVRFARLALVVVDEQHRFGVAQRAALRDKTGDGHLRQPHLLLTTATPIPRTLALTLHGDLDVTTLDERPPGRPPIETRLCSGARGHLRAWSELVRRLEEGAQGYVVCPVIEGGDGNVPDDAPPGAGVEATFDRLQRALPHLAAGLLHGRIPAAERDLTMRRFAAGELRLLVATTVIEVGVDVPAASVMLIESAERFGLAQLHQLRGRIGRAAAGSGNGDRGSERGSMRGRIGRAAAGSGNGTDRGSERGSMRGRIGRAAGDTTGDAADRPLCLLCTPAGPSSDAGRRLAALAATDDGFAIAEADLAARGPGELLGVRQAGLPRLRFADLTRHLPLLTGAREAAQAIIAADPELTLPAHATTRAVLDARLRAAASATG